MMAIPARVEEASLATDRLAAALAACPRAPHYLVLDHPGGAEAVKALLGGAAAPSRPCRAVLCGAAASEGWPGWCQVTTATDRETGLATLRAEIGAWPMGTQLHPIGSATLVAEASLIAAEASMHRDGVHGVVLDAGLRRVQCVHCKAIAAVGAACSHHACAACGTVLKVRSLFSERHQAFLGVADPELAA